MTIFTLCTFLIRLIADFEKNIHKNDNILQIRKIWIILKQEIDQSLNQFQKLAKTLVIVF